MYDLEDANITEARKKKILKAGQIFIIIILILTFTSKSIRNLTLPKVSVTKVNAGNLTLEIIGAGSIRAVDRIECYLDLYSVVNKVNFSVGDIVSKGDIIMLLDKESLDKELLKKEIEMKKLKINYNNAMVEDAEDIIFIYEKGYKEIENELIRVGADLETKEVLYNEGAISKNELMNLRNEYSLIQLKFNAAEKELNKRLEMVKTQSDNLQNKLKLMELDISILEIDIKELKNKIENSSVTAAKDGIIRELNFKEGMVINNSRPIYVLDSPEEGFEVEIIISHKESQYLEIEDSVQVQIKSAVGASMEGRVKSIKIIENSSNRLITISVDDINLKGGEVADVYIRKPMGSYKFLIPRQAVREDEMGKFVFVVKEKSGPLGKEYYVVRNSVQTGDSDYSKIGIVSGLLGDERIVINSSKSLYDGSQVIIE